MKTSDIKGIIPPVITPMNNDPEQTVNHQALREQVERLLAGGVHGIFPMGTNGEAYALSFQEKEEILATVIDQVKGRVPVYAGTGCITTAETIRLSKRAEELGADALSIITPSFALASQKELYDHYTAVAKAVNLPIILYNIPARTGNKLLPETVQALCRDVENIVGAKDSSGDIENLKAYIRLTRELDKEVAILAGNDGAILTCLKEGGAGGIAGRANRCQDLRLLQGRRSGGRTGCTGRHCHPAADLQVRQPQHHHQDRRCPAGSPRWQVPRTLQLCAGRGHGGHQEGSGRERGQGSALKRTEARRRLL